MQIRLGCAPGKGAMAVPALVDAALQLAKQPSAAGAQALSGGAAALLALESLTACSPEEREANRWAGLDQRV